VMLSGMVGRHGISLPEFLQPSFGFLQGWGVQFNQWMPNIQLEVEQVEDVYEIDPTTAMLKILLLWGIVWFLPNTQQWLGPWLSEADAAPTPPTEPVPLGGKARAGSLAGSWAKPSVHPAIWKALKWQPSAYWAVLSAILTAIALLHLSQVSEFLYFEF
jgi:hypothetical protein